MEKPYDHSVIAEHWIDPRWAQWDGKPAVLAVFHENYPPDTPLHSHSRGQLLGAQHGLITVSMENSQWLVPASHAVWLPPHHPHALRAHGLFTGWSLYVAESDCSTLPDNPCTVRTSGLIREAIMRAANWQGMERDAIQRSLETVMLEEIRTMPTENLGLLFPQNPRLLRVTSVLLEDLSDQRSVNEWAIWAGMSVRSFSRYFVSETGLGFSVWRQRARLLRALELLAREEPVTTIALELGYENVGAFIEMFRRHFGVTPKKYFVYHPSSSK